MAASVSDFFPPSFLLWALLFPNCSAYFVHFVFFTIPMRCDASLQAFRRGVCFSIFLAFFFSLSCLILFAPMCVCVGTISFPLSLALFPKGSVLECSIALVFLYLFALVFVCCCCIFFAFSPLCDCFRLICVFFSLSLSLLCCSCCIISFAGSCLTLCVTFTAFFLFLCISLTCPLPCFPPFDMCTCVCFACFFPLYQFLPLSPFFSLIATILFCSCGLWD